MVSEEKDPATLWNMHKKNIVPMLHSYIDVVDFVEASLESEIKRQQHHSRFKFIRS